MSETLLDFQRRGAALMRRHDARWIRRLSRAEKALRLSAAKLSEERRRAAAARRAVDALSDQYSGRADHAQYVAILATLRVHRALDGESSDV